MTCDPAYRLDPIFTLAMVGLKPNTSPRDRLTIARRALRRVCAERDAIHTARRALFRKARKLRKFEPFTKGAADALEQQARNHGAEELILLQSVLLSYGQSLLHDHHGYMAALGFDTVCALLSVNRVEQDLARAGRASDLAGLILAYNVEDSASRRGEAYAGGPLFEACFAAFLEAIHEALPGTLPDPFAPGAPLYGKLIRTMRVDGTVAIKRPDLVVHDASGSRVVKR